METVDVMFHRFFCVPSIVLIDFHHRNLTICFEKRVLSLTRMIRDKETVIDIRCPDEVRRQGVESTIHDREHYSRLSLISLLRRVQMESFSTLKSEGAFTKRDTQAAEYTRR